MLLQASSAEVVRTVKIFDDIACKVKGRNSTIWCKYTIALTTEQKIFTARKAQGNNYKKNFGS
jgi:hypothetical protein